MTDEQIALARRAVACSGFRWMPGMRYGSVDVIEGTASPWSFNGYERVGEHVDMVAYTDWVPCLPDLEDPATLGCLLALVREAWWQDDMGASRYKDQWCVDVTPQEAPNYAFYAFYGASEAEALVAALEAAP